MLSYCYVSGISRKTKLTQDSKNLSEPEAMKDTRASTSEATGPRYDLEVMLASVNEDARIEFKPNVMMGAEIIEW